MIEVDGQKMPWHPSMTLESLLKKVDHKGLCAVVRLNGKLVSSPNFGKTVVQDNDTIQTLPLIAGG